MRVIIVDDEQSARMTLISILHEFFKDVEVIAEADTPNKAIELIDAKNPDLVFLDIQMQNGTGFDVLEAFTKPTFQVIFISAHKQHAFDSFRFNASDYLLKPVRIKDLRTALEKIRESLKGQPEPVASPMLRQLSIEQQNMQLIIPEFDGFSVLRLSEIIHCDGSRNYTDFHMIDDRKVTATKGLKEFEDLLLNYSFIRIHKSHLINLYQMSSYARGRGGEVTMRNGLVLPVSRILKDPLIELFL